MPKNGRSLVGMAAGFIPEWWPVFDRNGGRLHAGIRTLSFWRGVVVLKGRPRKGR